MTFAGKWIELEIIMFNEINQTGKTKDWVFSPMCKNQI